MCLVSHHLPLWHCNAHFILFPSNMLPPPPTPSLFKHETLFGAFGLSQHLTPSHRSNNTLSGYFQGHACIVRRAVRKGGRSGYQKVAEWSRESGSLAKGVLWLPLPIAFLEDMTPMIPWYRESTITVTLNLWFVWVAKGSADKGYLCVRICVMRVTSVIRDWWYV